MSDTIIVAAVSDIHAGSSVAVCPPGPIVQDDGGMFVPSLAQRWLWQCWCDYWSEVERERERDAAELIVIYNGDLVEGDHHNTSQIISRNPTIEAEIVREVLEVPERLGPTRQFVVRGTETHVGNSGSREEGIARGLGAVPDLDTGRASWWHLRMELQGILIDIAHHGRAGQREHTRQNAVNLYAHDIFLSHTKRGERPPDLCLRGHFHRFADSYDACPTRVVHGGAWQLHTGHTRKKHTDSMADIGGTIVTIRDERYEVRKRNFLATRGAVWTAESK